MEEKERFCSKCGKQVKADGKFCNYCGNELELEEPKEFYKEKKNSNFNIKVIISIIIVILIIGIMIFISIKKQPKIIELNNNNFNDYIILDVSVDDFETKNGSGLYGWFQGVAKLNVSARLKKDVEVDNVTIKGRIILNGLCWTGNEYTFELELDKNGTATYSKEINTGEAGILKPETPTIATNLYGKKGNEFLVKNTSYITVEGNIIE